MVGDSEIRHPVDRLIHEAAQFGREITSAEIGQILERIATAPFNPRVVRVPVEERELSYYGEILGARASSLTYHLFKRVVVEGQWALGTTTVEYLKDLRHAVRHPDAQCAVYYRRGGVIAATVTLTRAVVPKARLGPNAQPLLFVAYSADRGVVISGYQIRSLDTLAIPENARWLKR